MSKAQNIVKQNEKFMKTQMKQQQEEQRKICRARLKKKLNQQK